MFQSMQLPSPPGTSHREEKENRQIFANNSRVSWAEENRIHSLTSSPLSINVKPSATYEAPVKSILRKFSSFPFSDAPQEVEREETPEPESALLDASYLAGPVSRIIPPDSSMKDLIQSYNILAARIRTLAAASTTAIDASQPLFLPLRDNVDALVIAVTRDLARVLVQPVVPQEQVHKTPLPSPRSTPNRKKRGMGEVEVKYARDLATTTHSVIKFLALLFCSPSLCQIFNDDHMSSILTQILAIPMAEELPTPNSRKTCALAIWLIQVQRLPAAVAGPAKDRIAYALRRGIEGELGKEGKKGSASDGLKAIHDLSIHHPSIFVPAFTDLLPSILNNLLASTLALRVQACHALGGFAVGLLAMPRSYLHTRVSNAVSIYLLMPPSTPSKTSAQESAIVRTLRTVLNNQDPAHPAQGPVWALSVIASLLILLGPAAYSDSQLSRTFTAHCGLAMRHKKSSVRALGCLLWRCVTWVYFQPPLLARDPDADDEEEESASSQESVSPSNLETRREHWWKLVSGVLEMGVGVSTVIALLAEARSSPSSDSLTTISKLLISMVRKGGPTCGEALQIVKRLIPDASEDQEDDELAMDAEEYDWADLVPKGLFTSCPGLLTVDFKSLSSIVKPIFDECPGVEDVRSLTQEELSEDGVFKGLVRIWRESLRALEIVGRADPPTETLEIWELLLKAKLNQVKDSEEGSTAFAEQLSHLLVDIARDNQIRPSPISSWESDELPSPTSSPSKSGPPTPSKTGSRSNSALRIFVVHHLWTVTKSVLPSELVHTICPGLLSYLKESHDVIVPATGSSPDGDEDARSEWGMFCADVLMECNISSVQRFLGSNKIFRHDVKMVKRWEHDMRALAWRSFTEKWAEVEEDWEDGVAVLLLPIVSCDEPWMFTDEDLTTWDKLLSHTLAKALDNGVEPQSVLEQLAGRISAHHAPTWTCATRLVDVIVSNLDVANSKDVPTEVMDLANLTMVSSYPPAPRNKLFSCWLIRAVAKVVDECPLNLVTQLLQKIQEGLSMWISDEYQVFTPDEYNYDLVDFYSTCLLALQGQSDRSLEFLETFSEIIGSGFSGRPDKPSAIDEAFGEFWKATYTDTREPPDGWPAPIRLALSASLTPYHNPEGTPDESSRADVAAQPEPAAASPTKAILDEDELRPGASDKLSQNVDVSRPLTMADTRIIGRSPPSTPSRRQNTHLSPVRLNEDRSPLIDLRRVPALSFCPSPIPRVQRDKENIRPARSRGVPSPVSVLGKRKLGGDIIDDPVTPVKRKTNSGAQVPTHRTPEENLLMPTISPVEAGLDRDPPTKRRKVQLLDAVEVPTYQQYLEAKKPTVQEPPSSSTERTGLRMSLGHLPRKKTRVTFLDNPESEDFSLDDIQIAGSDDSIMLAKPCQGAELSSDDESNVTRTPHLVVSPSRGAKRVHDDDWDADPPSDDSTPESPSKQLVERRLRRYGSASSMGQKSPVRYMQAIISQE